MIKHDFSNKISRLLNEGEGVHIRASSKRVRSNKDGQFTSSSRNFESQQVYNPQAFGCNDVLGELAVTG